MNITPKQYETLKDLLEDNKNGNFFSKGNYLSNESLSFVLGIVKEYENKLQALEDYKNG